MKKCLFILILFVSLCSFGQQVADFSETRLSREVLNAITTNNTLNQNNLRNSKTQAPGDVIWSEDFTGGFPIGWTMVDNTGNGYDWILNTSTANIVADFTNRPPIASTSGGNHMLLFGDGYNAGGGTIEMDAYFQTAGVTLSGQPNVTVKFQQELRLCCSPNPQLNLLVSTDPAFTVNVQTFDLQGGAGVNIQSTNPEKVSINITSIAGGLVGDIYFRFHWASGASHYYWMIDDIEIVETISNDLVVSSPYYGFSGKPYTRIPKAHIQPVDFSILVDNVGAADQVNTLLTVRDNGLVVATATPTIIFTGASDSLFVSGYTPLSTTGIPHNLTLFVNSDSVDALPLNNNVSFDPFEITDTVYAMDDFGLPINGGGVNGSSSEFEAGNFFDAVNNDTATSITVVVGPNTVSGTMIDFVLYEFTAGNFVEIARSAIHTTTSTDPGNALTLPLNTNGSPIILDAGVTYFAAVHTLTEFFYGVSGSSPNNLDPGGATSLIYYPNMTAPSPGQNFFTTQTPMVRLNVVGSSSITGIENSGASKLDITIYPNPASKQLSIFGRGVIIDEINILDITGKILKRFVTDFNSVDISDLSSGVYLIRVMAEEKTSMRKFIKE